MEYSETAIASRITFPADAQTRKPMSVVCNSSAQDFAFTAKSVKIRKLSQGNLSLAEGDLEWADSVTGKPKAELLQLFLRKHWIS